MVSCMVTGNERLMTMPPRGWSSQVCFSQSPGSGDLVQPLILVGKAVLVDDHTQSPARSIQIPRSYRSAGKPSSSHADKRGKQQVRGGMFTRYGDKVIFNMHHSWSLFVINKGPTPRPVALPLLRGCIVPAPGQYAVAEFGDVEFTGDGPFVEVCTSSEYNVE